jgi:hypothetical protein
MRKYRYLAAAASAAVLLALPASALAASPHKAPAPVLTTGKVGGTAVKDGAVLKASLPKGGKVTLSIGSSAKTTCTSASFAAKVGKNPSAKGKATLSITAETISHCAAVKVLGITATVSLKAINLDYAGTVSTAKGDPIVIAGSKKSKPVGFDASVKVSGVGTLLCVFTAPSATGHGSNKKNTVSFTNETFKLNTKASNGFCADAGTSASFTATFGPIVDSSVKHSPKVYIS